MAKTTSETLPTWDLSDLYAGLDDPRLEADLRALRERAEAFARTFKGTLAVADLEAAHLRSALDAFEALLRAQSKPLAYAELVFSTNSQDPKRGALLQRTREAASAIGARLVFFNLEIGKIPEAAYARLKDDPRLVPYRHYLDHQRARAAHHLSEAEERILVEIANARGPAFARLFSELSARTRFTFEHDGRREELTQSEVLAKLYDPDRTVRQAAGRAVTAAMQRNAHVGTFIYNTLIHEKDVLDRLRGYAEPEDARHLDNELDPDLVRTMVQVCVRNYEVVARYYRLKRKLLGLDRLTHIDRYAPVGSTETEIPFARAREIVLTAFDKFSPRLQELAVPFFERRWIDAPPAAGKQGGAYCAGITPDLHPYVFLNYTGQARDVMTLAHELGHGVHDLLASRNHMLDYQPALPLAETASTFGEMLVFDHLLAELDRPEERLALLCSKLEDTFATVFRQVAMYRFEQEAHRARRRQGELPVEAFNALWQRTQQEMFGEALTLEEEHGWWWLYIPHIVHYPFYVYAYAFGELLVLSLYARYRQAPQGFIERYFELLAAGGSAAPATLVGRLGCDIADPAFWQSGCDLIRARVEEAQALAARCETSG